ncbi:MAG: glucose-1-phosphate adenylyltransferase [Nitrospirota bacterium]
MSRTVQPRILAMIMAGGRGERLAPLTDFRTKPAVPFGGKYRIIDFVLSNFVNSDVMAIYALVQYRSQSLIEHLRRAWRIGGRIPQNFITVVPPQMKTGAMVYEGTADAVFQNVNLIHDFAPDLVAVFGADHIYRMDIRQMVDFHLARKAQITVAALPVPLASASAFGVIEADQEDRIVGFDEKPKRPKPMPGDPTRAYASMGNYLFEADALVDVLNEDSMHGGSHDFGRDIIPRMVGGHRVVAYNFLTNDIPDLQAYEEHGYWRDVGTIDAYWQAHMDLLGERPRFDLHNAGWPIMSDSYDGPAASLVRARVDASMIGQGSHIVDSDIIRSVIGRNVRIDSGCRIEESVILDGSIIREGCRLRRVIADRFNVIPPRTVLGDDAITVLPRGRSVGGRAVNVTGS